MSELTSPVSCLNKSDMMRFVLLILALHCPPHNAFVLHHVIFKCFRVERTREEAKSSLQNPCG